MKKKMIILSLSLIGLILVFLLFDLKASSWEYALARRIPRLGAMLLTAVVVAMASLLFQTVTENRILTPNILGMDALYLLLQTLVVFMFSEKSGVLFDQRINFMISIVLMIGASVLLYKTIFKREQRQIFHLLLVGIIFSTLFQSVSSFMQMLIDPNEFSIVQNKMFASFNNINLELLGVAGFILGLTLLFLYPHMYKLDTMALGRDAAISLGIDYEKMTRVLLFAIVIMISVVTALIGPITFLGLLVVNLAREIFKTYQHKVLIPGSVLIGAIAILGGQLFAQYLLDNMVPLTIIINFVGGLYFIILLVKEGKND